jgi:hypothetical protein
MVPAGSRIRFKVRLSQGPTEETPAFVFAEAGQLGTVSGYSERGTWRYSVKADGWPTPFLASENEFEAIEEPTHVD